MTILTVLLILLSLAIAAVLAAWCAFRYTLRDPERTPPGEKDIIVSPADGRIKYIKRIENGQIPYAEKKGRKIPITDSTKEFPIESGYLVGVWMSFLVVHVQRVPLDGTVAQQYYHACGKFLDPHLQEGADYENERNIVAISNSNFDSPILVIQIASIMVRRIVSFLKEGDKVGIGDRLGLIRMGSQVDIVIPHNEKLKLQVEEGDRVFAGESVIARFSGQP
jgi:phosphatidylserine decarboxylase